MKKLIVRKYEDFVVKIDRKFNIIFFDIFTQKEYVFPIILDDKVTLDIPENYFEIIDFMNDKVKFLMDNNIFLFLKLLKMEITPFIWVLMKNAKIDLFYSKDSLYVIDFDTEKYIVFNNKNMSVDIVDKMYRNQIMTDNSYYSECKDELYTFVRTKIQNGIGHNEFVNNQMENFKETQKEMEKEFLKNQHFNIKNVLFLYEKLIRIREKYLDENNNLLPQEVIDEISKTVDTIRELIKSCPSYKTESYDEIYQD